MSAMGGAIPVRLPGESSLLRSSPTAAMATGLAASSSRCASSVRPRSSRRDHRRSSSIPSAPSWRWSTPSSPARRGRCCPMYRWWPLRRSPRRDRRAPGHRPRAAAPRPPRPAPLRSRADRARGAADAGRRRRSDSAAGSAGRRRARHATPTPTPVQKAAKPATPAALHAPALAGQTFVWVAAPGASGYEFQLFRSGERIFRTRVVKPRLVLPGRWRQDGRPYSLVPGDYRWYVWPVSSQTKRQSAVATVQAKLAIGGQPR